MEKLAGYAFAAGAGATLIALGAYLLYVISGVRAARMATAGGPSTTTRVAFVAGPTTVSFGQYASLIAWLAFIVLGAGLVFRTIAAGHGPFTNMYEFSVAFAFGILGAFLWFERKYHQRGLALIVLPITLAMLAYAIFMVPADIRPLVPALQNNLLLTIHVAMAIVAYGSFTVAFAASLLYRAQGPWSLLWLISLAAIPCAVLNLWVLFIVFVIPVPLIIAKAILTGAESALGTIKLPKLEILDELGYRAIVVGFPFLTLTIVLGALWADTAWGRYWGWDPKETASLVTWFIYGAYLHARVMRGWRGNKAAMVLYVGFFAVILTYFGNLFFGGLHAYGGLS